MSRNFRDVICIDHCFPDDQDVFPIMDSQTHYSVGGVISITSMSDAIPVFESLWISAFWTPNSVHGDKAFENDAFKG